MIYQVFSKTLFVVALMSMTACLRTTVNLSPENGIVTFKERQSFFLFGLAPSEQRVNASYMCPDAKLTKFESKTTFLDGLLQGVTIGIYSPKTLVAWCKS